MMTPRLVCGVVMALGAVTLATDAAAQPERNVQILAAGGFLGHVESFCEYPGGPYDLTVTHQQPCGDTPNGPWWLGGVFGVRRWIESQPANPLRLTLLSGNNYPRPFVSAARTPTPAATMNRQAQEARSVSFWEGIRQLQPTVIALGPDDFMRGLRGSNPSMPSAGRFATELSALKLPFLASNAFIRLEPKDTSAVKVGNVRLVSGANSIPWDAKSIEVEYPCGSAVVTLSEDGIDDSARVLQSEAAPVCQRGRALDTLSLPPGILTPGSNYLVSVAVGAATSTFKVKTHVPLTPPPARQAGGPAPALGRFPALALELGNGVELVVISLVDPLTKSTAGEEAWTYEGDSCPANTTCVLDLLDPVKTIESLRAAIHAGNGGRRQAFVLISELSDVQTLNVLEAIPEIRVAILPATSRLLGRRALNTDSDLVKRGREFSGDYGGMATRNVEDPTTTLVLARPEWFGETGAAIMSAWSRETAYQEVTLAADPGGLKIQTIGGFAFRSRQPAPNTVVYETDSTNGPVDLGTQFVPYVNCPAASTTDECEAFRAGWSDKDNLNTLLADAVLRYGRTELAVLPSDLVDEDVAAWLQRELPGKGASWLSRFMLDRVVYRSPRIVRASVEGSKLIETLQKVLALTTAFGDSYCVWGTGRTGSAACGETAIDKNHLEDVRVNGRVVDPRAFYTVAMPDVLAESLPLPHSDRSGDVVDIEDVANQSFATPPSRPGGWYVVPHKPPAAGNAFSGLVQRLGGRIQRRWTSYLMIPTLDFGLARTTLSDVGERTAAPNIVPEISGVKTSDSVTVTTEVDAALVDAYRFAVRAVTTVGYLRKSTETRDTATLRRSITSYDKNELTAGLRVDLKLHKGWEFRLYGAGMVDGALRDTVSDLTAKTEPPQNVPFAVDANRFVHARLGFDALGSQTPLGLFGEKLKLSISRVSIATNSGEATAIPVEAVVNGELRGFETLLNSGPQQVLDDYVKERPGAAYAMTLSTRRLAQQRFDMDVQGTATFKPHDKTVTGELTYQARRYRYSGEAPLATRSQEKLTVKLTAPIVWRLQLVGQYDYQQVRIEHEREEFKFSRFDLKVNLPLFLKWGRGIAGVVR